MDLAISSGLGMEVLTGSGSGTNSLVGSGSMVGGGSHFWSVAGADSGSDFVVGPGIIIRSAADDLSCCLGQSGLGR